MHIIPHNNPINLPNKCVYINICRNKTSPHPNQSWFFYRDVRSDKLRTAVFIYPSKTHKSLSPVLWPVKYSICNSVCLKSRVCSIAIDEEPDLRILSSMTATGYMCACAAEFLINNLP